MRIVICDDDERELSRLSELIAEYQASRGKDMDCHMYGNGTDFLCETGSGEYDLVLLDVLMPGVNGMQAARELRKRDKNVRIILLSAAPEFAVESYSVGAYHYLLKPADKDLLFELLDRVEGELAVQSGQGFLLRNREGVVRIAFAALAYVEVINKTIFCHMADGVTYETNGALKEFEENFAGREDFVKTHRSYLVNLSCVRAIDANYAVTQNGERIPISRLRHKSVQDAYIRFQNKAGTADFAADAGEKWTGRRKNSDGLWRILLVDDDPAERTIWADILKDHGCEVRMAQDGREALRLAAEETFACVLLDVMMPGEDGFSICEKIRKLADVPVIFLSSATETGSQLDGFAAGGIDYITKDTPAALFWTKVETRIRLAGSERTQFSYGTLLLDLAGRLVWVNGGKLALTPVEFDMLWYLSEHAGQVYAPKEISDRIWGSQSWDGGQNVQTHMSGLRRKLEKAYGGHCFIETVWGQGYRFVSEKE